jgi:hypothetical protein
MHSYVEGPTGEDETAGPNGQRLRKHPPRQGCPCTLLALVVSDDQALGRLQHRRLPGRVPPEQNNQAYGLVRRST